MLPSRQKIHPGWAQVEPLRNWERPERAWKVEIEKRAEPERGGKLQGVTRSEGGTGFACRLLCMLGGVRRLSKPQKTGNHLQKNFGGSKSPKMEGMRPKILPPLSVCECGDLITCWFWSTLKSLFAPHVYSLRLRSHQRFLLGPRPLHCSSSFSIKNYSW